MRLGFHFGPIFVGLIVHEAFCFLLGFIFAHFVYAKKAGSVAAMGFVWGVFGWIFVNNLFSKSFHDVLALEIPQGAAFFVWVAFGLALTNLVIVDKMFQSK